jgi:hypothetical protein
VAPISSAAMANQQIEAMEEQETGRGAAPALFGATILSSACLLFLVQPLASKMILPVFGGSSGSRACCSFKQDYFSDTCIHMC